jgi:hypothetical protein
MPLPALALGALKGAAINKGLDVLGAPQGVRDVVGFVTDPKGFARNAIKNAVIENTPAEYRDAVEFVADPKGFARNAVKDAVLKNIESNEGPNYSDETLAELEGMRKGGKVSSASKRADGCCKRGKTRGKIY